MTDRGGACTLLSIMARKPPDVGQRIRAAIDNPPPALTPDELAAWPRLVELAVRAEYGGISIVDTAKAAGVSKEVARASLASGLAKLRELLRAAGWGES